MSLPSDRRISTMSIHDLPQRDLDREITAQHREYSTPLSNTNLYTRGGHLANYKAKKNTFGDHKDHKHSFVDLERSKIISHNTKILKIDLR